MFDEPEITLEDTNPRKPVTLEERLRQEEPPFADGDTSPSRRLPPEEKPRRGQRLLALLILVGALGMTLAATYIWMESDESGSSEESQPVVAIQPSPTFSVSVAADTVVETEEAVVQQAPVVASPANGDTIAVFPTAAADEIAVALLTPAPDGVGAASVQRQSEPFTTHSEEVRTEVVHYTVLQGDTLDSIASTFGLTDFWPIIWSNSRSKYGSLRPGIQLAIPPEDGVYYEVTDNITIQELADKYKVDPFTIIDSEYNNLFGSVPSTLLPTGMFVMIPGGTGEKVNLMPANTNNTSGSSYVTGSYSLWGCSSNISGGTMPTQRPLGSYTWMQGFVAGGHTGVDLSPKQGIGQPVFAAGSGTVVFAGWNSTGFGNTVVIGHGSYFTIYGHMDRYSVNCGQSVSAGQQVGTVGNTGNSTGPHLHFEVHDANWNLVNPQNLVGF